MVGLTDARGVLALRKDAGGYRRAAAATDVLVSVVDRRRMMLHATSTTTSTSISTTASSSAKRFCICRTHKRFGHRISRLQRRSASQVDSESFESSESSEFSDFDAKLALSLAGHSFFAYREPSRYARKDRVAESDVLFLDRAYVLKSYAGTLNVKSLSVDFGEAADKSSQVFLSVSVGEDIQNTDFCCREEGGGTFTCDGGWQFLLKTSRNQRVQIRVWKKRFLRPDELLGVSIFPLETFAGNSCSTAPLRGGSAEGKLSVDVDFSDFEAMEDVQEDSSDMVLDLIGIKDAPLLHFNFKPCCFISNTETDTQVWLWWNSEAKELIVAFRGTEQTQWKDLLTDVRVLPTSINEEGVKDIHLLANKNEVTVHNGFLSAYLSIRNALITQVKAMTDGHGDDWTMYVTGHSLGGALATIFAYECAELDVGKVIMYNYGSPRVGNKAFVDEFKRRVDSSWRFSNASDIIPTVPRFLGYRHVDNAMRIEEDGILQIVEDKDVIGEAHFAELFGEELESFLDFEMEELLEKELDLLSSLIDGRALQEHMEENYLRNLIKLAGGLAKLE